MKKKIFLGFCLWGLCAPAYTALMNDEEYEKTIHDIYLKHYKNPSSDKQCSKKNQSFPKDYQLKKGDNLWNLSDKFFENSLCWSRLWSSNSQLENPHVIYKGKYLKTDFDKLKSSSSKNKKTQTLFPDVIIPEQPFMKDALKEEEIPSSLPKLALNVKPESHKIVLDLFKSQDFPKKIIIPFYLTDTSPSIVGEIVSKSNYGEVIGFPGESIIVRVDKEVSIGDVFTVFENKGSPFTTYQFLSGATGEEIAIKGKIKILSYLKETNSLYLASVLTSLQSLFTGDVFFEGEPKQYDSSKTGPIGKGEGYIIGSSQKDQTLLSLGSIVYLDKGFENGIQDGDVFYIKENPNTKQLFDRPYSPVLGKLKVIHTLSDQSTGVIIDAKMLIYVKDIFTGETGETTDPDFEKSPSIEIEELTEPVEETTGDEGKSFGPIEAPPTEPDTEGGLDMESESVKETIPPGTEPIEEADTLNQGQELFIDVEETTGDEGKSFGPTKTPLKIETDEEALEKAYEAKDKEIEEEFSKEEYPDESEEEIFTDEDLEENNQQKFTEDDLKSYEVIEGKDDLIEEEFELNIDDLDSYEFTDTLEDEEAEELLEKNEYNEEDKDKEIEEAFETYPDDDSDELFF